MRRLSALRFADGVCPIGIRQEWIEGWEEREKVAHQEIPEVSKIFRLPGRRGRLHPISGQIGIGRIQSQSSKKSSEVK